MRLDTESDDVEPTREVRTEELGQLVAARLAKGTTRAAGTAQAR